MKKLFIGIFSALLLIGNQLNACIGFSIIPPGKVVDTIKCINNRQQSYALYLPSYYNVINRYPVIYIFEPAARGSLPVSKYKDLAEEFGFILVCSNNSKNGPQEPTDKAASAVFTDTQIRFTIDTSRIYTMGFSGGARVATRLAIQMSNIKGVIGCGAGFPYEYKPNKWNRFTYVGLIGNLDMNYYELKNLEPLLNNCDLKHYMVYFNENHIWPPKEEIRKAFIYLKFDAMQRKLAKIDSVYIADFKQERLDSINNEKNVFNQYIGSRDLLKHIINLSETDELESKINMLLKEPSVNQKLASEKHYLKIESELSNLYGKAFFRSEEYALQWWKKEMAKLNSNTEDSLNVEMLNVSTRMINKVYLMVFEDYMLNSRTLSFEQSIRNFKIATLAKPKSPYPEYYLASIYSKNKKAGPAIKMLENSIAKGFTNLEYLKQDKNFDNLRTKKKFVELEKKLLNQ